MPLTDLDFLLEDSKRGLNIKIDLKRLFQKEKHSQQKSITKPKLERANSSLTL